MNGQVDHLGQTFPVGQKGRQAVIEYIVWEGEGRAAG